jgi:hypothetical protein
MLGGIERADGEGKVGMVKGLVSKVMAVQLGSGASVLPFGGTLLALHGVLYHGVWSLEFGVWGLQKIPLVLLSLLSGRLFVCFAKREN